ncbi:J domain-containing protein [Pseudomonas fitomaticsae]|uniref:J domain-containing protein n=1 Tax=Pseudomonas fitomaticsae TaxID=2837969 RepID=A0ABY3Q9F4_9PSED|nr:J domain-containing protein [Pseudomonas fitomaticsae]UFQ02807.1 J domain-containing protein [Pseudomonas fitomaticsae]
MSCWTVLGLSADADVRTIKRQYAVLLKQTRPDDDPEGFQRLRDAYEQALAYKEWQQYHEQNPDEEQEQTQDQGIEESWDLSGLTVVEVDALQLATRSLDGLSVEELNHRHAVTLEQGCAHFFEDTVLHHCIEHPETSQTLVDWAIPTFFWFSAWQRLELDEISIDLLLDQQRARIAQPMRDALEREDVDGFLQAYARCADFNWLAIEQHRQWFNRALSHLLLDAPFWSPEIFERVRTGQGWHGCTGNPCPDGEWQRLLARQNAPFFVARQQQLALEPPATPEHRAARLLLGTGSFSARRALARRLREDDWAQCRKLSSELYANHPKVCAQMPGGTAFFWRDWELSFNDWPTYVGVVLACLIGAFTHYIPLGVRLSGLINIVMISTVVFGVIVAGLNWLVHNVAHRVWRLDDRLSASLCPGPLKDSPPFGVLRDLVPGALMVAGLGWFFGPIAGGVYAATLATFGLVRRWQSRPRVSWEESRPAVKVGVTILGILVLALVLGVFKVVASQGTVNRNQGLQPWTERLCSRLPATTAECSAPATVEQWYGKEARP